MRETIKVLLLAADPAHADAAARLEKVVRTIEHGVRTGPAPDTLELVPHLATCAADLRDALLRHQPRIVHIAGPGDAHDALYLADEHGHPRAVETDGMGSLLGALRGSARVVVLNGCGTMRIVEALSEGIDYTVDMRCAAGEESAAVFAQAFYSALGMGCTVLTAFEFGVVRLELEGTPQAALPVRRIRRGVNLDETLVSRPAPRGRGCGGPRR
ncbi:hypothetical protein [Longimicrobium sp.]|uniref:hypothetical protein n=1 Tax=Longimicrobium sp. TaxID=2029185 RepID=UPI003B3A672B